MSTIALIAYVVGVIVTFGLAGPALAVAGLVKPAERLGFLGLPGLSITVIGFALLLVAQYGMGDSWRVGVDEDERTELVTTGIFARVRNPIFTGVIISMIGLAIMVPTVVSAVAALTMIAALKLHVRTVEEPYLEEVHGMKYQEYCARTGRFLPRLR